jgi:hypothetical protein
MGVTQHDLLSTKRTARVSHARQIAIYLSRELTSLSLAQIAREFNRDHSTILHAIRSVKAKLEPGSETAASVDRARHLIQPIATPTTTGGGAPPKPVNPPPELSTGKPPIPSP